MAGLQVSGLVSGIDTQSLITQLMQVEANPQTLLKNQLSAVQADAAAYRAVNTRFAALRTAAEAVTDASAWTATKATSSSSTVAASAGANALSGSLRFHVDQLAASHSMVTKRTTPWADTAAAYGASSLAVKVGATTTTIPITGSGAGAGKPSLADAVAAINASRAGLTATAVQISTGKYQLQITTKTSGEAATFTLDDGVNTFDTVTPGADAKVTVGTGTGKYTVASSTNTFSGLIADTTFTVSQADTDATVSVAADPGSMATKMQSLVDAANSLLDSITSYTDPKSASAILKGDSTLRAFSGQILDMVSRAVVGVSASVAGLEVTKDGKLEFDKGVFTAKLSSAPATVKDMFTKTTLIDAGPDKIAGNADDRTEPVGIAVKLLALGKSASDKTTGAVTTLANSEDSLAKDLQSRIDAWDLRLALRRTTLTTQFTAMTSALSTLQNQSSWLSSQINGLPSWSSSSKS